MRVPSAVLVSFLMLVAGLLALAGYAFEHERRVMPVLQAAAPAASDQAASAPASAQAASAPRAFTAEEEAYSVALWPVHRDLVELAAAQLATAALEYATEKHDVTVLVSRLQPVRDEFAAAEAKTRALVPPAALQDVHQRYLDAIMLYEKATTEVLRIGHDSDDQHLVEAQPMSLRGAEELIKVGDVLWPGEHKPN